MTTFYLIRHGEAEGNLYQLMHGQVDSDLTALGRKQAAALGRRFQDIPLTAVWSSPLRRAMLTAAEICLPKRLPLYIDPRLTEINVGPWEGLPFGNAARDNPDEMDLFLFRPDLWQLPGADTLEALADRGCEALRSLAAAYPDGTLALCLHSYLLRAIMCRLFYGLEHFAEGGISYNTAVTALVFDENGPRILFENDYSHLTEQSGETLVRIRPARNRLNLCFDPFGSDIERYIRYRKDAWQLIYPEHIDDFSGASFWLDAQKNMGRDPRSILHATHDGKPVGILQLSPDREAGRGVGYIPFIYLREPYRSRGLGIQLIGQAVMFYREAGRKKLQLSVAHTNAHAIAFYEKYGFTRVGKHPGRYGKLQLMEKNIALTPMPKRLKLITPK